MPDTFQGACLGNQRTNRSSGLTRLNLSRTSFARITTVWKCPPSSRPSQVVSGIRQYFLKLQRERIQRAIDCKRQQAEYEKHHLAWLAEEAIRVRKEKEQAHVNAIKSVIGARKQDLINAAAWWRQSCSITDFIEECERRWKHPTGELNSEQAAWLAWAREIANSVSPFTAGYPEPANHGTFDASTILFGGPYPSVKNFQQPS